MEISNNRKQRFIKVLISVLMLIMSLSFLYPLFFMLINALKTKTEYYTDPFGMPAEVIWENFRIIFQDYGIWKNILNSTIIAVASTGVILVLSCVASYAFAKMNFKGKNLVYLAILVTIFLPAQVTMIPRYVMFSKMDLINTHLAVIICYVVGGIPGAILLLRNTFMGVPSEVIESAKLDGAGFFTILFRIMVPMNTAGLSIVVIFQALSCWNDYMTPMLFITSRSRQPLMVILSQMVQRYGSEPTRQFAGLLISVVPTILLYLVLQKHMVKGATSGAIK